MHARMQRTNARTHAHTEEELPIDINFTKMEDWLSERQKIKGDWRNVLRKIQVVYLYIDIYELCVFLWANNMSILISIISKLESVITSAVLNYY